MNQSRLLSLRSVFKSAISLVPTLAVSILFAITANAAVYYISPSGNDGNPGTVDQPFQNISRGVNQAGPGDVIILRDGVYGNEGHTGGSDPGVTIYNAGSPSAYITLKAEHKGNAVLDCGTVGNNLGCTWNIYLANSAAYWSFEDLVLTGGAWGGIGTNNGASHIQIVRSSFQNIGNWDNPTQIGEDGVGFDASATDWHVEGNFFTNIGRVQEWNLDHGIYAEGSNAMIINNVFVNLVRGFSIQVANGAQYWMIANNTFIHGNPRLDGQIMLWSSNTGITIRNNIFYQPTNYGVVRFASYLNGCWIDHNLVYGASGVLQDTSGCNMLGGDLIGVDPMIANINSPYNFGLQGGSPAINAGAAVDGVTTDFFSTPRPEGGAPIDIGATQHAAAGAVTGVVSSGGLTTSSGPAPADAPSPAPIRTVFWPTSLLGIPGLSGN